MKVFETQLPGVGRRYQVSFANGRALTIVIHNDGTREVFWRDDLDTDSESLFTVTEEDARRLAEIFDGTFFGPIGDDLDEALSEARIKWVSVPMDSSVAGRTIGQVDVRSQTGISILAVERGEEIIANPTPDTKMQADDVLVVVGSDDAHERLEELLAS